METMLTLRLRMQAIEGVMDSIIAKNIFHNNGNDLVAKINARILDYKSTDVMDV
jgi:hypothetical protein